MLSILKRSVIPLLAMAGSLGSSLLVADDTVPSREDLTYGSISAVVTAIEPASRSVMLKFDDGREEEFELGDQIEDVSKIKVGDTVLAGYARSLAMELRKPTAEEIANPLDVTEVIEGHDAESGTGSAGRLIRAVTTVEVLDRINMTATLMGPLGNYLTIDVKDPDLITKVYIGDTVVATYTEAVVLSLAKAE